MELAAPASTSAGHGFWRSVGHYVAGARPRTLPAAVVPVGVGTAVAHVQGEVVWWRALLALVVALAMQVGTNYANDYSDGVRGADHARVGPMRLVASGAASPRAVKRAAIVTFGVGALSGLALAVATTPVLVGVGALCIAAGWLYTGGPRPYGYLGFGEVFVFVFFGLVAVAGTTYVESGQLSALAAVAALPVGLAAVALLVVNNLRDIPGDAASGKRTLAVRLGAARTRVLYAACTLLAVASSAALAPWRPGALLGLAALAFAWRPLRVVLGRASGRELIPALAMTGALQLLLGAFVIIGLLW